MSQSKLMKLLYEESSIDPSSEAKSIYEIGYGVTNKDLSSTYQNQQDDPSGEYTKVLMEDLMIAAREAGQPNVLYSHNSQAMQSQNSQVFNSDQNTFNPSPPIAVKPRLEMAPETDNEVSPERPLVAKDVE